MRLHSTNIDSTIREALPENVRIRSVTSALAYRGSEIIAAVKHVIVHDHV